MPHLFVDISSHGFGHLAQTGPVLNALAAIVPDLRLTIRSGLATKQLQLRIEPAFAHLPGASDVAFLMHDAVRLDREATAAAYRSVHADWAARVADEAGFLSALAPDLVLSNISALPLAGARQAGIPALALCSLNWADQFRYLYTGEAWAEDIAEQLMAAYAGADAFLRCLPALPMPGLKNTVDIPPLACIGEDRRAQLEHLLGRQGERLVLVAMGGIGFQLPLAQWPQVPGIRWLIAEPLPVARPDVSAYAPLGEQGMPFTDLLASVDAIVTKPGYGTFVEAATAGTPVLYLQRDLWPEQDVLIEWLQQEVRCEEISAEEFSSGQLAGKLDRLWSLPGKQVSANGAGIAAEAIAAQLKRNSRNA